MDVEIQTETLTAKEVVLLQDYYTICLWGDSDSEGIELTLEGDSIRILPKENMSNMLHNAQSYTYNAFAKVSAPNEKPIRIQLSGNHPFIAQIECRQFVD